MTGSNRWLFWFGLAICSVNNVAANSNDSSARPRGVGPEFAKYYKDSLNFTCISNPNIKVPFSAVNDDYCDCPDGSDEPGTSACSYLSRLSPILRDGTSESASDRSVVLPGFYCANKGHRPSYISHLRVNDGVCDYDICCDGSDEWAHPGGFKCENKCKSVGAEWRKEEDKRQKSMTAALHKRKELVAKAASVRRGLEAKVASLEEEVQQAQAKVETLKADLEVVKAEEKLKAKNEVRTKSKAAELAEVAKQRIESLRQALIDAQRQRDEGRSRTTEVEMILDKLKSEYNPNFNDEGVKRAIRLYEDFSARYTTENVIDYTRENEIDEIARPDDAEHGIDFEKWMHDEVSTPRTGMVACIPDSIYNFAQEKWAPIKSALINNGLLPDDDKGSPFGTPRAVEKAQNAVHDAESRVLDKERERDDHKQQLEKNYGKDHVFQSMEGSCIARDSGEYTYELCWMTHTMQKSKKGGSNSNMGNFEGFTTVTVDELVPSGKVEAVERIGLRYSNGAHCWNGPLRSTLVVLQCGEKDEILKISEDEKCVYSMQVTTPAVCESPAKAAQKERNDFKDEL
ncbi:hypothetical protein KEM54_006587 [Ascosphaera aggregata]|nr:hypothetical protein KEM54_006587 [Ascosphaera aggregata]